MAQPYPISRESREEAVFFGDGGAVYGPFALKIFDIDDVEVWTKASGGTWTIATPTVAKVDPAAAFDEFTITFAAVVPLTTKIKVLSARVHERSAGVTAGTKLSPDALEKELTKLGTIVQELRRDIERAALSEFGVAGYRIADDLVDGDVLMKDGGRMIKGANAALITQAEGFAEVASVAAGQSQAARDEAVTLVGQASTALQPGDPTDDLVYTPPFTGATPTILTDWLAKGASPKNFSAVGNGISTDTTPIINWLSTLAGDGIRGIGEPGTFLVDPIALSIAGDVVIEGAPGMSIKGIPSAALPVIRLDGLTARPRVDMRGLTIDNSAMPFVSAGQSGTGLSLVRIDGFSIRGMEFLGGANLADLTTGFGDSGITTVECGSGEITFNRFVKQPDLGVYLSGGASTGDTDDYGDIIVANNVMTYCNAGISAKRQSRRLIAADNVITQGRVGISLFEASSIDPGREAILTGNAIHKMGSRAIDLRGSYGDVVNGNQIVDWGYKLDGVSPDAAKDAAIVLLGVERASIGDNTVIFRDWANSSHKAIRMSEYTMEDTTVRQTRRNILMGNNLFGMTTGIEENNSSTENYGDNYISATTPAVFATGSTSIYKHTATNGLSRKQGNGILERFNLLGAVEGDLLRFERNGTNVGAITSDSAGHAFITGGARLPTYTVAGVPSAVGRDRQLVYISNEVGGATVAFSDGTNWRRVQDRAIIA